MTEEEREIVLNDCNRKLEEIEYQKKVEEHAWEACYHEKYKRRFALEDALGKVASSFITGLVICGSAFTLSKTGHSMAISFGVPIGAYAAVGLSALGVTLANTKKKKEYWQDLAIHTSIVEELDEENSLYKLISKYITVGDKYLLELYRESLKSKSLGKEEFDYLDFDTTNLSPLMIKVLEEIKARSLQLRNELRDSILKEISLTQMQIAESTTISIPELEEVQKMLKQHVPKTTEAQALTK